LRVSEHSRCLHVSVNAARRSPWLERKGGGDLLQGRPGLLSGGKRAPLARRGFSSSGAGSLR
jgi:hypothetical protein